MKAQNVLIMLGALIMLAGGIARAIETLRPVDVPQLSHSVEPWDNG